jgi:hippurate hydrolase
LNQTKARGRHQCWFYLQFHQTPGHGACMVHNSGYDFSDANLPIGAAYWALLVQRFLSD